MANRRQPTHLERSLYLVDYQCERLGISRARLFTAIASEFDALGFGRFAPKEDTLEAMRKGRRPIAFQSRFEGAPTWLDICEWRFGESYCHFFHPFFTLLFGPLAQSEQLRRRGLLTPTTWMKGAADARDTERLERYRQENARVSKRVPLVPTRSDDLTRVHLAFLALPQEARNVLMTRRGLSTTWRRSWADIGTEINSHKAVEGLDSLTVLAGLTMEAAVIGDVKRFERAAKSLDGGLRRALRLPRFKRIKEWMRRAVAIKLDELRPWRYGVSAALAFGYPDSIAARVGEDLMLARFERWESRGASQD